MRISDQLVAEFDQESSGTRRMLERLTDDKLVWKPHSKSMSMGGLATHIGSIPSWARAIVDDDGLDMAAVDARVEERRTRAAILELFDENVRGFREALSAKSDEHMLSSWTLKNAGKVVLSIPRAACIRSFVLSHVIHHRGQLTVYFRQNDIAVPALYGPSADEAM